LGARRLSMSPLSAALVRYALRASHLDSLEKLARAALNSDSAQTVSTLVTDVLRRICPECHSDAVMV
jgi:signal transduction protein with GAF and PtsI domain